MMLKQLLAKVNLFGGIEYKVERAWNFMQMWKSKKILNWVPKYEFKKLKVINWYAKNG